MKRYVGIIMLIPVGLLWLVGFITTMDKIVGPIATICIVTLLWTGIAIYLIWDEK